MLRNRRLVKLCSCQELWFSTVDSQLGPSRYYLHNVFQMGETDIPLLVTINYHERSTALHLGVCLACL